MSTLVIILCATIIPVSIIISCVILGLSIECCCPSFNIRQYVYDCLHPRRKQTGTEIENENTDIEMQKKYRQCVIKLIQYIAILMII